jgi:hypothetical protein
LHAGLEFLRTGGAVEDGVGGTGGGLQGFDCVGVYGEGGERGERGQSEVEVGETSAGWSDWKRTG